jgi:hypothetical protein
MPKMADLQAVILGDYAQVTLNDGGIAPNLTWRRITQSQTISIGSAYYCEAVSMLQLLLPAAAAIGDQFLVFAANGVNWRIAQNADQSVLVGNQATTNGIAGRVENTAQGDWIRCTYSVSGRWIETGMHGNLLVL